jgi:hypothetical protein
MGKYLWLLVRQRTGDEERRGEERRGRGRRERDRERETGEGVGRRDKG